MNHPPNPGPQYRVLYSTVYALLAYCFYFFFIMKYGVFAFYYMTIQIYALAVLLVTMLLQLHLYSYSLERMFTRDKTLYTSTFK